jgi:hypothetical protein
MCDELGCCATIQKWLIFIVNLILFIAGIAQIGIASYVLAAGSDYLGFTADLFEGDDDAVNSVLALGIIFIFISFWGCVGAKKESKCMLWIYALILFLLILGQAMSVAVVAVSVEYGDSIFGSLWQELDAETIDAIEQAYECCSFNGNSNYTWKSDTENYKNCSANYAAENVEDVESCWQKFKGKVEDNYNMVKGATSVFLAFQILIYFSTHYVIQAIAEAEGAEEAREEMVDEDEKNKPIV